MYLTSELVDAFRETIQLVFSCPRDRLHLDFCMALLDVGDLPG